MKTKTVSLDEETRSVLLRSKIDGCRLQLPEQLDRALYRKVAKAIEAAGGKWNKNAACHLFSQNVRKTMDIAEETVEVVNVKQTFQSFYTPPDIARRVAEMANVKGCFVLEPSCGEGALVQACLDCGATWVLCVDANPKVANPFQTRFTGMPVMLRTEDFMVISPVKGVLFDRVVMNPPFTGGQDIKHIRHAQKFLLPGGKLVAICAAGPKQREEFEDAAVWIDLPAGAFKESGTNVATAIVVLGAAQ